jgi:predicted ATPase
MVETHSDHVLNGVRLAIKEKLLSCEALRILSFDRDAGNDIRVSLPIVDQNGKIADWPPGFFDESEKTLLDLL